MLNDFILSYKLKNTYRVNSIIYTLKHIPLIKKMFSYSLYSSSKLKTFSNIVSSLLEFISFFAGKFIYLFVCISLTMNIYQNKPLAFINILFFMTIIGCLINTEMFNPSIDKYYAIFLLKFNAKKYVLSNYIYFLIKTIIGFIPFIIIFGLMYNVNILVCLLFPIFIVMMKNIFNYLSLIYFDSRAKILNENKYSTYYLILIVLLLGLAYFLPYINFGINEYMFYVIFFISLIFGIKSLTGIVAYNRYPIITKKLIKHDDIITFNFKENESIIYRKEINSESEISSEKEGFAYLNDLFVKRHRKLLSRSSKICSIVIVAIFILLTSFLLISGKYSQNINKLLKNCIPYFMFIMYFLNRGQKICQTMFMNCDHSMLTYRFYREPNAILLLFKERLKTLIKLNIIPGTLMAIGVVLLLFFTGGATTFEYIITLLSIISMSILFSIHYLVLYYLLQPYDINLEIKDPLFTLFCSLTYLICYFFSRLEIPTTTFGIYICIFTVVYSFISLFLSYKYARKTFKLRN